MFESVLVANRGEIASRITRTVRGLGLKAVAVHSDADADLPFVHEADEAVLIGPSAPAQSYLHARSVLEAARRHNARAVHPGYGFLAEDAGFARAVHAAGMAWVGPQPLTIARLGDKINARNLMKEAGVPVAPGVWEPVPDTETALEEAARIGYPVMVKAASGGGGIGMGVAHDEARLRAVYPAARSRAEMFFASADVLLERFVRGARHVEVQVIGRPDGSVVALGDRECSVQRRHQKIVEEGPAPGLPEALRARLHRAAVRAGEAVGYRGAGTVEFLIDPVTGEFYFVEMNARLQVEHPVTEMLTGLDLVEQQLRVAAGERVSFAGVRSRGHAIELRVYAEDPFRFAPRPGRIRVWEEPVGPGIRIDAGYAEGNSVTPYYDPLLAKLIVHGDTRDAALARARAAVAAFRIEGTLTTNLPFLAELLDNPEFVSGRYDTGIVGRMRPASN